MVDKKPVIVPLNDLETEALEELAKKKDVSKVAVMRQALRLYQLIENRIAEGEKLIFEDKKSRKEVLML